MTRLVSGALPRLLAPLLIGAALGVVIQVTEPEARLYALVSPGLLAGMVGLVGTVVLAAAWIRQRAAAATEAAVRGAVAKAAEDRLRFLMRLDHELKNPLTAIRAGLANIEQAGATATAETSGAALASVSAQANRITRLLGDLRKLADLETREIEAAPVDLPRSSPAAVPRAAFPVPASGSPWSVSLPSVTAGRSRFAAGTARARWSASGFRCRAVPELRPLSQIRDSAAIPAARCPPSFELAATD
jgi:two-component system, OmpR family, sensor kinase